jgi:enoyl-[acyl-carrier protein] reductase III
MAQELTGWAVILGASSGFGEATAIALARAGMDVFGVHLDRRGTMPNVERIVAEIRGLGRKALFFNVNAADEEKRRETIAAMQQHLGGDRGRVRVLLHSLAFGTLKPFFTERPDDSINQKQLEMTCDVMGHSLLYWTQDLLASGLLSDNARIFAMTSAGSRAAWRGYGAVSAAKAVLESHIRQIAVELAPRRITANAIMAGVTDTPALRKIPGNEEMIEVALRKAPAHRLTTPADVASAIVSLASESTYWVTGNTIQVDGGELVSG